MKKNYFLMLLFISVSSFSMPVFENFILTNDGTKIHIKPNFFRIDNTEKIVFYKLTSSDSESKIQFKDLKYIQIGANRFRTYKLNNSKEVNGYFILTDTDSKTLIFTTKTNEDEESTKINYVFYILNSSDIILDSLQFDNLKNAKSISARADIYSKIKYYFGDCEMLIKRITYCDNLSQQNQNMGILELFNSPIYIECLK